ncbi:MAG TPA: PHP-associated domain-containing protein [Dehalococcoidia bacterium]|nr:PHP-associated domain-containing protein [Dehalococcoidia bacterium]
MAGRRGALGKADLHIHTAVGDGMAEPAELLAYVEEETNLDVLAITDHDTLSGAYMTRELWARGRYSFDMVMGMEVTTLEGHLLALFIEEPVPSLRPLQQTLTAIHARGGLAIIPHPLSWLTRSLGQSAIEAVLATGGEGAYFDGIELSNQTLAARLTTQRARELNATRYRLADVGGSDAHFLPDVGSAHTLFPLASAPPGSRPLLGHKAQELRRAILASRTTSAAARRPAQASVGLGQLLRQQWRGITVTPRMVGFGPTVASFLRRFWPGRAAGPGGSGTTGGAAGPGGWV